MNNLAPMKNCPGGGGVQGNLNWMPGYHCLLRQNGFSEKEIQYFLEFQSVTYNIYNEPSRRYCMHFHVKFHENGYLIC